MVTAASGHQQIEKPRVCLVLVSLCQRRSFLSPPDQSHRDRTQAPYGSRPQDQASPYQGRGSVVKGVEAYERDDQACARSQDDSD